MFKSNTTVFRKDEELSFVNVKREANVLSKGADNTNIKFTKEITKCVCLCRLNAMLASTGH